MDANPEPPDKPTTYRRKDKVSRGGVVACVGSTVDALGSTASEMTPYNWHGGSEKGRKTRGYDCMEPCLRVTRCRK